MAAVVAQTVNVVQRLLFESTVIDPRFHHYSRQVKDPVRRPGAVVANG